jgi:hypothetical protein
MNHRPDDTHLQAAFDATRAAASQLPLPDQHARARQQFLTEAFGAAVSPDQAARLNDQGSAPPVLLIQLGDQEMNRKPLRSTRLIAAVLLGVLLAGGFWASPGLRALAQEIIEFFIPAKSDIQPASFYVGVEPNESGAAYIDPYTLTLDDVVAQAAFDVRLPTFLPHTLSFKGASYQNEGERIEMIYECRGTPFSYNITQYPANETASQMEVGWSAVIEDVPIRETIGQYVRGWWLLTIDKAAYDEQGDETGEIPATRVWSNETYFQQMFWNEDGINFSITTASGSLSSDINYEAICRIDRDVLAQIANGLLPTSQINID